MTHEQSEGEGRGDDSRAVRGGKGEEMTHEQSVFDGSFTFTLDGEGGGGSAGPGAAGSSCNKLPKPPKSELRRCGAEVVSMSPLSSNPPKPSSVSSS
jgi:hypothetical protein